MSIQDKLEEVKAVNKVRGKKNYTTSCVFRLGEDELSILDSYMKNKNINNAAQALRELLIRGGVDLMST